MKFPEGGSRALPPVKPSHIFGTWRTHVEHDGAWRHLRVGRKACRAVEGARRERLGYRPATPSPGMRPNHDQE